MLQIECPPGYTTRDYGGPSDHAAMAAALSDLHMLSGDGELITAEQFDVSYANHERTDLSLDFAIIEADGMGPIGYVRTGWDDTAQGRAHFALVALRRDHHAEALFVAAVRAVERRVAARIGDTGAYPLGDVLRFYADHPGPGLHPQSGAAKWIEDLGYRTVRFAASMVRPHLDDIPALRLPDGVEVRTVEDSHLRKIWDASVDAFLGTFGEAEQGEGEWREFRDDPIADRSLWRIAWHGDEVVGQVKSYINHEENAQRQRLRGYTEYIATHPRWRGRGIASALLAMSLEAVRDAGMTEAALGVDTENPANALAIYQRMGFELTSFEAMYDKPLTPAQAS